MELPEWPSCAGGGQGLPQSKNIMAGTVVYACVRAAFHQTTMIFLCPLAYIAERERKIP